MMNSNVIVRYSHHNVAILLHALDCFVLVLARLKYDADYCDCVLWVFAIFACVSLGILFGW